MLQLAQINIGHLKYPIDDPRSAEFVNNIDRINLVAERSDVFVWRYKDEDPHFVETDYPYDSSRFIINMSVWESPETLERFVWQTVHKKVYAKKDQWFETVDRMHLAMWWVDVGVRPSLKESFARLNHLNTHGSSDYAFGWDHLPHIHLWKSARCA